MKQTKEIDIETLTQQLTNLQIRQEDLKQDIRTVERQLKLLKGEPSIINTNHVGRRCKVKNPRQHQPSKGTIFGFTKGANPFIKVKAAGYQEIRRLPKNLELLPEEN